MAEVLGNIKGSVFQDLFFDELNDTFVAILILEWQPPTSKIARL